jgi:hypothetical protein
MQLMHRIGKASPQMNRFRLRLSAVARGELEETWRLKADRAQKRYMAATELYKKLLAESQGRVPTADNRLERARQTQSAALEEYRRVLKIFAEFTLNGQSPSISPVKTECDSE